MEDYGQEHFSVPGANNEGVIDKLTKLAISQNQGISYTNRGLRTQNNMTCITDNHHQILSHAGADQLAGMTSVRSTNSNMPNNNNNTTQQ